MTLRVKSSEGYVFVSLSLILILNETQAAFPIRIEHRNLLTMSKRHLPLMTKDFKVARHPQAKVVQNGVPDHRELARRANLTSGAKPLFAMPQFDGTMSDAKYLAEEGNIAFFVVTDPMTQPHMVNRTLLNRTTAMSVSATLNGMVGTPESIQADIQVAGMIEQSNADTKEAVFNIINGGAHTMLWNNPKPIRMGGLIEAIVPTPTEANLMMTDKESQARGVHGNVPLMLNEYIPLKTRYLQPPALLHFENNLALKKTPMGKAVRKLPRIMLEFAQFVNGLADKSLEGIRASLKNALTDYVNGKSTDATIACLNAVQKCVTSMANAKLQRERNVIGRAHQPSANGCYFPMVFMHYHF